MLKYWIVKLFHFSCNNMYMDGWIKEWIKSLYVKNYIVPARVCKFFQQIAAKLIPILTSKDILANLGWKLEWTCNDNLNFCQLSVCSSSICMWFILLSYGFPVVWLLMDGFFFMIFHTGTSYRGSCFNSFTFITESTKLSCFK